jgi:hypothetical protein
METEPDRDTPPLDARANQCYTGHVMFRWIVTGLIILWIVCMWGVLIYALKRGWGPYVRSKRQKKARVRARIGSKLGAQELNPLEWRMEYIQKALVFECEDGAERHFDVHDDIWDWVEVGDEGDLVYQGHLFVEFDAYRARIDPDKLYQRLVRH